MFCRSRLADFEVPKQIHLVSTIPKNAMGKVKRRDLTALFSWRNPSAHTFERPLFTPV